MLTGEEYKGSLQDGRVNRSPGGHVPFLLEADCADLYGANVADAVNGNFVVCEQVEQLGRGAGEIDGKRHKARRRRD